MKKALTTLCLLLCYVLVYGQTTVNVTKTIQPNLDTLITTTTTTVTVNVTNVTHKYNAPTPVNPGGSPMSSTTYNNHNNITLTGKTVTGGTLVFNNCNNVNISMCKFDGGKGTNLYAIFLNNCTNVTVTNNYGTMYCKFVMVMNGSGIKVNNNQFLNLYEAPGLYGNDFAHVIQFNTVAGSGNQINGNIIENIYGVAVHPHDLINLYNCAGTSTSHIQVNGNKMRGGQVDGGWPNPGDTGAGITMDNGSYIDCTNNIGVNPGCALIQANGSHSNILIDSNIGVSLIASKVAADGIIALGAKSNCTISNNKINWVNKNGKTGNTYPGGEVMFWFGGSTNPVGITLKNNVFDKTLTAAVLPATIITYK